MNLFRRQFLRLAAGAAALSASSRIAMAQTYPLRPVRLVVGFPAGSAADIVARLIGQWLADHLGQPFVIENRPGAGGNIATESVVRALPDGYSLLWITSANAISATVYDNLNFNFINDIAAVASIARGPYVMVVNPSFPAKSVAEFVAYAKANPGEVIMASAGAGTGTHVAGALLMRMTGIDMVHVPYRGDTPALTDLLAAQVHVYFSTLPPCIENIRIGKLRALAVTTAARSEAVPEIPTVGESVPGYEASLWNGIGAPKGTPAEIVEKLNAEINAALADPSIKGRLSGLGSTISASSAAEFGKLVAEDTEKWRNLIRAANIKAQ